MALFEMSSESTLTSIPVTSFASMGVYERTHLQKALRAQISAITPGVRTMVIAEEFGDWVGANRRIDLLCLDEDAKLVVVELKRDDGAHMELQALRYAAMVSTMVFDQAVEAHRKYLASIGSTGDPEQAIRDFLRVDEGRVAIHEEVRIVLAAASFGQELTTAVLWLNKQGLDLRCVQMRPHVLGGRMLLDVQQVIPLPEAAQYQVAIREKEMAQAEARSSERNTTRFNLTVGNQVFSNLAGRRVVYELVRAAFREGITVDAITKAIPFKNQSLFLSAEGDLSEQELLALTKHSGTGYFTQDSMLLKRDGRTLALTKRWGEQLQLAISSILDLMPSAPIQIEVAAASGMTVSATYEGYEILQDESTTITVMKDGLQITPAKPVLRMLAELLGVSELNGSGNELNTRQLGAKVIEAALQRDE
ncbi:hypothetical protein LJR129_005080 [Acidovorax sp. LjRoot129]|uniref:hypothetical protein n=1 Tax=unclassified Acidovorax TaxID=2684926 RepID=UPI003ECD0474